MAFQGKLIIFTAPSGSGKTTIVKQIKSLIPNLAFSVSATSRPPRNGEIHGVDYYFLSPDDFKKKIEAKEFVEWEQVYEGKYYGTLKSEIEKKWSQGKHILFDVDVVGALNLKKQFGKDALTIFIKPPSIDELANRLKKRGTENEESLVQRINKAYKEMSFAPYFDKIIVNDNLENAVVETYRAITEYLDNKI